MDTTQNALNFVSSKKYPFFKIYKGSNRAAICDAEENPDKAPEIAIELFTRELNDLTAGKYKVSVYRNSNGEKSALSLDFEKSYSQTQAVGGMHGMDYNVIMEMARREAERDIRLQTIEKKIDAIAESILLLNDKEEDNDNKGLEILKTIFSVAGKKGNAVSSAPAETARRIVNRGAFSDL